MKLKPIKYSELNPRQKENYNFHKVAARLADYGYNSIRLTDDYKGADFLAVHIEGEEILKVQLKGRFTLDKKYKGKAIWIAFIENGTVMFYDHDYVLKQLEKEIAHTKSWQKDGSYSWRSFPQRHVSLITTP